MRTSSKFVLVTVSVVLVMSLAFNVRAFWRMKQISESSYYRDETLMRCMPLMDILSRTNECWGQSKSIHAVRDVVWTIFRTGAYERDRCRDLGLIDKSETEMQIDKLVNRYKDCPLPN